MLIRAAIVHEHSIAEAGFEAMSCLGQDQLHQLRKNTYPRPTFQGFQGSFRERLRPAQSGAARETEHDGSLALGVTRDAVIASAGDGWLLFGDHCRPALPLPILERHFSNICSEIPDRKPGGRTFVRAPAFCASGPALLLAFRKIYAAALWSRRGAPSQPLAHPLRPANVIRSHRAGLPSHVISVTSSGRAILGHPSRKSDRRSRSDAPLWRRISNPSPMRMKGTATRP